MCNFIIPEALQIDMDDMGWFCGTDDRPNGGPSRTGIPRQHTVADYEAVNELGRRLNMKINCALVIGEWDPDNRLRKIPYLSKYGEDWNNAAYFDRALANECAEVLNQSQHINLCVHGILHGYYRSGLDSHDISDFYYRINKKLFSVPQNEIRARLDAFFDLIEYHGIKKHIHTMIPPSFAYQWNDLSYVLKEYGIQYVGTIFSSMKCQENEEKPFTVGIEKSGMITYDRHSNPIPWDSFGGDYETMPLLSGLIGTHWPNFLHECPERNMETVIRAEAYFKRCGNRFGAVISRDVALFVTQAMYRRYAKASEENGVFTIDISSVPVIDGMNTCFYVNTKHPIASHEGCTISICEEHTSHTVYEITPHGSLLRLTVASISV